MSIENSRGPSRGQLILLGLALALALLASRGWKAAPALQAEARCVDEIELTLSAVDRLAGLPSTTLAWPGTAQQLLFLPLFGAYYVVECGGRPSPGGLADFLGHVYRMPWMAILLMRGVVTLISTAGIVWLALAVARRKGAASAGLVLGALLLTHVQTWDLTSQATGDGASIGFTAIALALALSSPAPVAVLGAGIAFGLALASKFTCVLALPLLVALALQPSGARWRVLAIAVAGTLVGLAIGCPPLTFDMMRVAKSVVGNMSRSGTPQGLLGAGGILFGESLGLVMSAGVVAALAAGLAARRLALSAGLAACFALAIGLTARAGVVYPRYFAVLALVAALAAVLALWPERGRRPGGGVMWICGGLVLAALQCSLGWRALSFNEEAGWEAVPNYLGRLATGARVAGPASHEEWLYMRASCESLRAMADACEQAGLGPRWAGAPASSGLGPLFEVLKPSVNEDEQAFVQRRRTAARVRCEAPLELQLHNPAAIAARFGTPTLEECVASLRAGELDVLISRVEIPDLTATLTFPPGEAPNCWIYEAAEFQRRPAD